MASAGLAAAEKLFLSSTSVSPPPTKRRRHRQGRKNRDLLQNLRSNQNRISNKVTRKLKDQDSKQSEAIKNAMGLTLLERLSKGATEGAQTSPKIVFQGAGKNESKTDIDQKQLLLAKSVGEKKDLAMSRESTSLSFPDTTLLTPKPLSPMFPPNVRSDSGLSSASNSFSGNSNTQKGGQSNDEDAMDTIKRRLEEVQQMTKQSPVPSSISPKPAIGFNVMSRIATSLKKFKKKISPANRARNCLRHSARLALLIKNGFTGRKKYYIEDDFSVDDDSEGQSKFKDVITETLSADMFVRSSIDWETQMCLRTMPHLRSDKQIKRVVCLLRATKAFSHIFPDYVEEELARYLAYEIYDDGRLIAYQGRKPERLYYIIAGKINILRHYELKSGEVTRSFGILTKGMTTDVMEMKRQTEREANMIAKGQVEVFILYYEDYFDLQRTALGPPIDFIQSLDLFQEFPCSRFENNNEVIDYEFFPKGHVITQDTSSSPWIHIVHSGHVKVTRVQDVVDVSTDQMFTTPNRHELGCGKSFSHADNMLGPGQLVQQKKIKTYSHIVLPKIPINSKNNCSKTKCVSGSKEPTEDGTVSNEPNENDGDAEKEDVKIEHLKKISPQSSDSDLGRFLPPRLESVAEEPQKRYTGSGGSRRIFPPIHIPVASGRLFLTKEHTEIDKHFRPRRQKQDGDKHRQACVQLDYLGPGDIIGLEQMRKPKSWEPVIKGYCLISDGAEVIRINKRFFLQNAENNTMIKLETMIREYLSVDESKGVLQRKETWARYKDLLMQKCVGDVQYKKKTAASPR